jgi:hypothetical protein
MVKKLCAEIKVDKVTVLQMLMQEVNKSRASEQDGVGLLDEVNKRKSLGNLNTG